MKELNLRVTPREDHDRDMLKSRIAEALGMDTGSVGEFRVTSRSIDARQKRVMLNLRVQIAERGESLPARTEAPEGRQVLPSSPEVIIIGAGPAGLFGALKALELGMRPIVIERGRDVDSRRKDIACISRSGVVEPESNFCFGEGGAGTFSDGKLYTRSKKRGPVDEILTLLVRHGADESILWDAHPHIGTDRLGNIIKRIREYIISKGGEVRFETRMEKLLIADGNVRGVVLSDGSEIQGPVVLATGHSARDVYKMLHENGVAVEPKGIAVGVRLEHPQELIDKIQYHNPKGRGPWLPAAEYSFVTQVDGRGVYSFCMCPGGVIVPAASQPGELVVNGMSASGRSGRWANSGMVVELRPEDVGVEYGDDALKMMRFQSALEHNFYSAAGNSLKAPAQRMLDFVKGKVSTSLPAGSYAPGMLALPVHFLLPDHISRRLRKGFEIFGSKAKGFLTNEAVVVGLESRTSSPVRVPRDKNTLCHPEIKGLYPAGEGAGYAGGIVSAAIDGRRAVEALYNAISGKTENKN